MTIAIMSHERKKELMAQFCIAYCGTLSQHTLCSPSETGSYITESTGLTVKTFLSHEQGGVQQIGARIAYNEIDMVLFFTDAKLGPSIHEASHDISFITRQCDQCNIPIATNLATAELLVHGLARGDLDWRVVLFPKTKPFVV